MQSRQSICSHKYSKDVNDIEFRQKITLLDPVLHFLMSLIETVLKSTQNTCDGAHDISVQKVTSNCNVATLISFLFSLHVARRLASGETFIRW